MSTCDIGYYLIPVAYKYTYCSSVLGNPRELNTRSGYVCNVLKVKRQLNMV